MIGTGSIRRRVMADEIELFPAGPTDLATLPEGTTAVEAHDLDDVALANLVALHPLVRLDVSDSTPPPTSTTPG